MKNNKLIHIDKTIARIIYSFAIISTLFVNQISAQNDPDYQNLLDQSIRFFEAQACGEKPSFSTVEWRGSCHLTDGDDVGIDLKGGWHDAGDHVKFNYPMAQAIYNLASVYVDYKDQVIASGSKQRMLNQLRFIGDYMIKCHPSPNEYYIQVGDGVEDHKFWQKPENNTYFRKSFIANTSKPATDLACANAAGFAALSLAFKGEDDQYSAELLQHAKDLFDFGDTHRGKFGWHIPAAERNFYDSNTEDDGYFDDILIGAVWLYRASQETKYLDKAKEIYQTPFIKYLGSYAPSFRDHHYEGVYQLASITNDAEHTKTIRDYVNGVVNGSTGYTASSGLWDPRGANDYGFTLPLTLGGAMIVYKYADLVGSSNPEYQKYIDFAVRQVEYASGENPANRSFITGFGNNFPTRAHHRGAHDPNGTAIDSNPTENTHVLPGALVMGPISSTEQYDRIRSQHKFTEVAVSMNSVLAVVAAQMVKQNPTTPSLSGTVEIENNFSIVSDVGDNGTIGADTFNPGASNGQYVRLFDNGDEVSTSFNITESGSYNLKLRTRVGEASGSSKNLRDKYQVFVDGVEYYFALLEKSVSTLDKDSYWGEFTQTFSNLSVGNHTVNIKAKSNWLKADRLKFSKVSQDPTQDIITSVSAPKKVSPGESVEVEIAYSATQNRDIRVSLQGNGDPNYNSYGSDTKSVTKGSGILIFNIPVNSNIPIGDNKYQFQTYITKSGLGWNDRFNILTRREVDGVNGVSDNSDNNSVITIGAEGACGGEKIQLLLNDENVKEWTLTTDIDFYNYNQYNGSDNIKVAFVNNSNGDCDNNVSIDWIQVCDVLYQTEEHAQRTGCGNEQMLLCNGNFNFDGIGCTNLQRASTTTLIAKDEALNIDIKVYPNPVVDGTFRLDSSNFEKNSTDDYTVRLYDFSGREVFMKRDFTFNQNIKIDNYLKGLYFLKVINENTNSEVKQFKILFN